MYEVHMRPGEQSPVYDRRNHWQVHSSYANLEDAMFCVSQRVSDVIKLMEYRIFDTKTKKFVQADFAKADKFGSN